MTDRDTRQLELDLADVAYKEAWRNYQDELSRSHGTLNVDVKTAYKAKCDAYERWKVADRAFFLNE